MIRNRVFTTESPFGRLRAGRGHRGRRRTWVFTTEARRTRRRAKLWGKHYENEGDFFEPQRSPVFAKATTRQAEVTEVWVTEYGGVGEESKKKGS